MTTEVDTELLRTLHRVLQQQTDLNSRIERGPARINIAKQAEAQFETTLQQAIDLRKETKMGADRKQMQLSERETKIEELKQKRNSCDSNREFQLFSDQIAADEQANSVQSDEIFELLEKLDEVTASVKQAEENLEKGKQETAKVKKLVAEDIANLQRDLDAVQAELAAAEGKLPFDLAKEYKRLVAAMGEEALAEVADNCCGHCYTTVTTQLVTELMMKRATFCKSCGSLLYLADQSVDSSEDATV